MSDASSAAPQIKFQEVLQRLVEESPFKSNRKPIWESLNITSAALSQYLQGQARPRLEVLVALADFFGVTLDYLVLDRELTREGSEAASAARYVDWALVDLQARAGEHSWLVTRIAHILATKIDESARELGLQGSRGGGIVTASDALLLEQYSLHSKVATWSMEHDFLYVNERPVVGRFAGAVADNLCADPVRPYDFLLLDRGQTDWRQDIHTYKKLLLEMGVPGERLRHCRFMVSNAPVFSGSFYYRLDVAGLTRNEPILFETLRRFIDEEGWIGLMYHTNSDTTADLLIGIEHLPYALRAFDELWAGGTAGI